MTTSARTVPPLPSAYSVSQAIDALLMAAGSQIGYREGQSASGAYNNDNAYGAWYGMNKQAWCHMFVSWAAWHAGLLGNVIPKEAYTPSGFNWFASRKVTDGRTPPSGKEATGTPKPRRGDIMYVHGYVAGEKRYRIHHVGIVEKVLPGGYVQTIEGNTNTTGSSQGNGVYRLKRKVTSRLFFAHPNYAAVVHKPPAPPAPPKGGTPKPPAKAPARITGYSLAGLQYAAKHDNLSGNYAAQRAQALASLKYLGLTSSVTPPKNVRWSQHFKDAWRAWQRTLGYRGADADGVPGETSIRRLASRSGLRYIQ